MKKDINIGIVVKPNADFTPIIGTYEKDSNSFMEKSVNTTPTIVTYGPFIYSVKGSQLNSWIAKNTPASLNLDAASRSAVLRKYGSINSGKTYTIRWYNKVETRLTSVNGTIVNVSCVN